MSTAVGFVAFVATYAATFERLTFWGTLGVSVLAQTFAFILVWAFEESML